MKKILALMLVAFMAATVIGCTTDTKPTTGSGVTKSTGETKK